MQVIKGIAFYSVGIRPLPGGSEGNWFENSELDDITCYADMLDMLVQENSRLKNQLEDAWQKIAKSHKVFSINYYFNYQSF